MQDGRLVSTPDFHRAPRPRHVARQHLKLVADSKSGQLTHVGAEIPLYHPTDHGGIAPALRSRLAVLGRCKLIRCCEIHSISSFMGGDRAG